MPKPTDIPTWATDAGATQDPGAARQASGFRAGKRLPAKWLNWALSRHGSWFQYLRDLHLEPEFLNKNYPWAGSHRFSADVGLVGEPVYVNAAGGTQGKERTVHLPLTHLAPADGDRTAWNLWHSAYGDYGKRGWIKTLDKTNSGLLLGEFTVPSGAQITKVSACVSCFPAATTVTMKCGYVGTVLFGGDVPPLLGGESSPTTHTGTTSQAIISVTPPAVVFYGYWMSPFVTFRISDTGGAYIHWVKVTFLDPGPRNY